eukprot:gene7076-5012_t
MSDLISESFNMERSMTGALAANLSRPYRQRRPSSPPFLMVQRTNKQINKQQTNAFSLLFNDKPGLLMHCHMQFVLDASIYPLTWLCTFLWLCTFSILFLFYFFFFWGRLAKQTLCACNIGVAPLRTSLAGRCRPPQCCSSPEFYMPTEDPLAELVQVCVEPSTSALCVPPRAGLIAACLQAGLDVLSEGDDAVSEALGGPLLHKLVRRGWVDAVAECMTADMPLDFTARDAHDRSALHWLCTYDVAESAAVAMLQAISERLQTHLQDNVDWDQSDDDGDDFVVLAAYHQRLSLFWPFVSDFAHFADCVRPIPLRPLVWSTDWEALAEGERARFAVVGNFVAPDRSTAALVKLCHAESRAPDNKQVLAEVERGADTCFRCLEMPECALYRVLSRGLEDCFAACLQTPHPVDFSAIDGCGTPFLHLFCSISEPAASRMLATLVRRLVTHPNDTINWNCTDSKGQTFFAVAAVKQRPQFLDIISPLFDGATRWIHSSVVEHSAAVRMVPGSNPGGSYFLLFKSIKGTQQSLLRPPPKGPLAPETSATIPVGCFLSLRILLSSMPPRRSADEEDPETKAILARLQGHVHFVSHREGDAYAAQVLADNEEPPTQPVDPVALKAALLDLQKEKDMIVRRIEDSMAVLEVAGVGMDKPLVDANGFPRGDCDLYAVRGARQTVICSRNDLVDVQNRMMEMLQQLHGATRELAAQQMKEDAPYREERRREAEARLAQEAERTRVNELLPFAVVTDVKPGSPAQEGGLRSGQLMVEFGDLNATNFKERGGLMGTVPVVQSHEAAGTPISVWVRTPGCGSTDPEKADLTQHHVVIAPWAGSGKLGCGLDVCESDGADAPLCPIKISRSILHCWWELIAADPWIPIPMKENSPANVGSDRSLSSEEALGWTPGMQKINDETPETSRDTKKNFAFFQRIHDVLHKQVVAEPGFKKKAEKDRVERERERSEKKYLIDAKDHNFMDVRTSPFIIHAFESNYSQPFSTLLLLLPVSHPRSTSVGVLDDHRKEQVTLRSYTYYLVAASLSCIFRPNSCGTSYFTMGDWGTDIHQTSSSSACLGAAPPELPPQNAKEAFARFHHRMHQWYDWHDPNEVPARQRYLLSGDDERSSSTSARLPLHATEPRRPHLSALSSGSLSAPHICTGALSSEEVRRPAQTSNRRS